MVSHWLGFSVDVTDCRARAIFAGIHIKRQDRRLETPFCDLFTVGEVVLCFRDSGDCLVVVLSLLNWFSTSFRNGPRWSKLRRGVLGSRARSELEEFWQMRSRLMGERSGRATSVQNRMCGRCGVAGDVTMTSWRAAREVQAGGRCKVGRVVYKFFGVEWRGKQKARSLEAENKELRARIDVMGEEEREQRGPDIPVKEGGRLGRCVERLHGSPG